MFTIKKKRKPVIKKFKFGKIHLQGSEGRGAEPFHLADRWKNEIKLPGKSEAVLSEVILRFYFWKILGEFACGDWNMARVCLCKLQTLNWYFLLNRNLFYCANWRECLWILTKPKVRKPWTGEAGDLWGLGHSLQTTNHGSNWNHTQSTPNWKTCIPTLSSSQFWGSRILNISISFLPHVSWFLIPLFINISWPHTID